ncbi:MAG: D-2-hydroxyacid dehydrogenase [Deltaproteobacteria bacterium]|jgi:glycerate dehydrogenase|nr:D-2-hydroxyacid dehydrogenase [Deltaproteobacteria bacterium]
MLKSIVVLDGYAFNPGDLSWAPFQKLTEEFFLYPRTEDSHILERIGNSPCILTNKTPITRETILASPNLQYIGILATGTDKVDLEASRSQGITVTNVPAYSTLSVAQFTIGLLLEITSRIGHHSHEVHKGRWKTVPDFCFWDYPLIELAGKTLGIIGYGAIGRTVGGIATALGMKVLAFNGDRPPRANETAPLVNFTELLTASDIISLHAPLKPETLGIINKASISGMKDGVIILNTARGGLIVEKDLAEALKSGKVYAAGLDVLEKEPADDDNPLLSLPNCLITPHIAWVPLEARKRLMNEAAENLRLFLLGTPRNRVNL